MEKIITIAEWQKAIHLSSRMNKANPEWNWPFPPGPCFPRWPRSYVNCVRYTPEGEQWLKDNNIAYSIQTKSDMLSKAFA